MNTHHEYPDAPTNARGDRPSIGKGGVLGVLQPVYLPWLGYFEQIAVADHFVLLDDVQYTKQDWRNRNRVRTSQGPRWLTVPVLRRPLGSPLAAIEIADEHAWRRRHLRTIEQAYSGCRFFRPLYDDLTRVLETDVPNLVDLTGALIKLLCRFLEIDTPISRASEISGIGPPAGDPNGRLIDLCRRFDAGIFYEGASGRNYLDVQRFRRAGIDVVFQDYRHPSYSQVHGGFVSHMSALDLIMNVGPSAPDILRSSPLPAALTLSDCGTPPELRPESTL